MECSCGGDMDQISDGDWVKYSDYQSLEEKLADQIKWDKALVVEINLCREEKKSLELENKRLREALEKIASVDLCSCRNGCEHIARQALEGGKE